MARRRRLRLPPLLPAAVLAALLCAPPVLASVDAFGDGPAATHTDTRGELREARVAATVADMPGDPGLPLRWCGDERASDDVEHAAFPPSAPQFKLVYARAGDQPDRFSGWQDALQANVALIQRFLGGQGGGTKALRFDMGTRCGPQYVDVASITLPRPRSAYVDQFDAIAGDVRRALGPPAGTRNVAILADGMTGSGAEYGLGQLMLGGTADAPGAGNVHNRGGFASVLFSRDGDPAPGADPRGWWPEGLLHEMTHNLGGVQWSAPHSTQPPGQVQPQYGHCWQGADVMCYVEDAGAAHAMRADCPRLPGAIPQAFDCGRDDYFNPAPPPGSYLATHWNTYDSAFLASCAELAPACGTGADPVPEPPVGTQAPSVAGPVRRGSLLTALPGSWDNGPVTLNLRWQRLQRGTWVDLPATSGFYQPVPADVGRALRVRVVASNADGSAVTASPPTPLVADRGIGRPAARSHRARSRHRGRRTGHNERKSHARIAARKAPVGLADPARPQLRPDGRADRRAHGGRGDGAGAQPPGRRDGR
jgi:hypothetical protein